METRRPDNLLNLRHQNSAGGEPYLALEVPKTQGKSKTHDQTNQVFSSWRKNFPAQIQDFEESIWLSMWIILRKTAILKNKILAVMEAIFSEFDHHEYPNWISRKVCKGAPPSPPKKGPKYKEANLYYPYCVIVLHVKQSSSSKRFVMGSLKDPIHLHVTPTLHTLWFDVWLLVPSTLLWSIAAS